MNKFNFKNHKNNINNEGDCVELTEILADKAPHLKNGILDQGGMMLLSGIPGIGKSCFALNLLTYMTFGESYLDKFIPTKPLNVVYLQNEVGKDVLSKRMRKIDIIQSSLELPRGSLIMSSFNKEFRFDDQGIEKVIKQIKEKLQNKLPDIICVDSLSSFFYAEEGDINSNEGLREFAHRVEALRDVINPAAGIILISSI